MLKNKVLELKKSSFFHDILHSFVTKGFSIGLGFFVTVLITRSFTVEVYGEYSFLLSIALTIFQFAHLGFSSANTFYVIQNKRLLPFLLANSNVLAAVVGVVSLFLLLILNAVYFHRDVNLIILTSLIVPFQVLSLLNTGLLFGLKKVITYNYLELFSKILYCIVVVAIVIYFKSVLLLLLAYLIQMFSLSITSYFSLKKLTKRKLLPSINLLKKTSSYSVRLYITLFLSFLVLKIDVYFIEHFLGNKPLGIYSLAATLASNLILIIQVLIPLLVPRLSEIKDDLKKIKKLMNIMGYAILLLVVINFFFLFFGEWIILMIFGEKYLNAVPIFKILLLASSVLSLEAILAQYYASIGKIKFLIYYWILTLLVNISLNYFWIPKYGIAGAAWSSLISYSLILILLLLKIYTESFLSKTKNENII